MSLGNVVKDASTRSQLLAITLSLILLAAVVAVMNFRWKELIPDVLPLVVGLAVIIFRKPYARSIINSQNSTWGTHYGDKEINRTARSSIIFGLVMIVWGIMATFDISFNVTVSESKETVMGAILFIVVGTFMLLVKEKDDRAIIHFNGKPAVINVAGKKIYLHQVLPKLFGLVAIVMGISLLLGEIG